MGYSATQKLQIGKETTKGTAVAATTIWRGTGMLEDARNQIVIKETVGKAVPSARIATSFLLGKLNMAATPATFEQLPYILEAGIKAATPSADSGTGDIYVYDVGLAAVNTVRSYTIEGGDSTAAEEMEYSTVESFVLSGKYGELMQMSANWFGRQVSSTTFTSALTLPTVEEVKASRGVLYIDEPGGTLGTTAITAGAIVDFNLNVNTGRVARSTVDSGAEYFLLDTFDQEKFSGKLTITWRHNSDATAEKVKWQAGTPRQLRLKFTGSALGTPGAHTYKSVIIDLVGIYTKFSALENESGDSTVKAEFEVGYDATANITPMTITVVCDDLAALP